MQPDPDPPADPSLTGECVRGRACADRRSTVDPDFGRVTVGAPSRQPLCDTCIRHLGYTLVALPLDVAELGALLVPSMAVRYRPPDMPAPTRVKLHAPLPLDGSAMALQDLIDHEVTSWAESTADAAGVPWDSRLEDRTRQLHRVRNGCQLLAYRIDWFLALPPTAHRVRSAGEEPTDGWPDEQRARMDMDPHGEWWIDRDGTEGALALFDLHRQVEGFVGRTPADRCPVPCPACERRALVREHRSRRVVCRYCWRPMTDDAYEQLVNVLDRTFGAAS